MKHSIGRISLLMLCAVGAFSLNGMDLTKLTPEQRARVDKKLGLASLTEEQRKQAVADMDALDKIWDRMHERFQIQMPSFNLNAYNEDIAELKPKDQALFRAIKEGNAKDVEAALKAGANKEIRLSRTGLTPVALAIQESKPAILTLLLDAGAYPDVKDAYNVGLGASAVMLFGSFLNNAAIIDILKKRGSKTIDTFYDDAALLAAAHAGETPQAQRSAPAAPAKIAAPSVMVSNPELDDKVNILLSRASQSRGATRAEKIEELKDSISQGANPNAVNGVGRSVLMRAIHLQDEGLVDLLLARGANPQTQDVEMAYDEVSQAFAKLIKNKLAARP